MIPSFDALEKHVYSIFPFVLSFSQVLSETESPI